MEKINVHYETRPLYEVLQKYGEGTYKPVISQEKIHYRWSLNQILNLVNSVARNFPIGLITLNDTDNSVYIADGYHRIYTLYQLLHADSDVVVPQVFYNMMTDCFFIGSESCHNPETVPLRKIYDTFSLIEIKEWAKSRYFANEEFAKRCLSNLDHINSAFQSYQVPIAFMSCSEKDMERFMANLFS